MDWKLYSFVVRGKYRKKIIVALNIERTPSQLSKITKINISHVSRALSELSLKGIAKCVNPKSRIGRIYKLSKKGFDIRKHIINSELW